MTNWVGKISQENLEMLQGETQEYILTEDGEHVLTANYFACVCEISRRKGPDWDPGQSWDGFEMDRVGGYDFIWTKNSAGGFDVRPGR